MVTECLEYNSDSALIPTYIAVGLAKRWRYVSFAGSSIYMVTGGGIRHCKKLATVVSFRITRLQ